MKKLNKKEYYKANPYKVLIGKNGTKCVDLHTVLKDVLNLSFKGNSKTGTVTAFNLPIEYSCDHTCECYSKKNCYACGGFYQMSNNQVSYSENLVYFLLHTSEEFIDHVVEDVKKNGQSALFRWFTCGDILNERFFECMIEVAKRLKRFKFWTYTKKYRIVNKYVETHGLNAIPENLVIIFSHWLNDDDTYFPMDNPYNFPTSEFIPLGKEELIDTVDYLCPCSDPTVLENCATCPHPCYELKHGQSMGLVEHSTKRTKARDKAIKLYHSTLDFVKDATFNLVAWLKSYDKNK